MSNRIQKSIDITPTLSTSAYSIGDQLGGEQVLTAMAFDDDTAAQLSTLAILDKDAEGPAIDVHFFNASPTVTSTDNQPFAISDAEMASKWIGSVRFLTTDFITTASTNKVANLSNILIDMKAASSSTKNLYVYCVIQTVTTYSATTDLVFKYSFVA